MAARKSSPNIKPTIRKLVAESALRYKEKPRAALAVELKDTIEKMGEASPKEDTLMRMISAARNNTSKLDEPWHLGTLESNSLQSGAIPYIFAIQRWKERTGRHDPLSTREAIWVARFFGLYPYPMDDEQTLDLYRVSHYYAVQEIVSNLSGMPNFDTTKIDAALRHGEIMKLIEVDILSIMEQGDSSPMMRARSEMDKALPENERDEIIQSRYQKAEEELLKELSKPESIEMMFKAEEYKTDHPEATKDDIFNYLRKLREDGDNNEGSYKATE